MAAAQKSPHCFLLLGISWILGRLIAWIVVLGSQTLDGGVIPHHINQVGSPCMPLTMGADPERRLRSMKHMFSDLYFWNGNIL